MIIIGFHSIESICRYTIDDLLTPSGGTACSLLTSHDGLPATTTSNDPLHGLLLGNTTAFDTITGPSTTTKGKENEGE